MAINLKLSIRTPDDPATSPWGRTWIGWDPDEPEEAVWAANRGVWNIGMRADHERYATMSFGGSVRVVAELTGRTLVPDHEGREKNALEGAVLPVGHPVREALIGRAVDQYRNPVTYFDTSKIEGDEIPDRPTSPRCFATVRTALILDADGTHAAVQTTSRGGEFEAVLQTLEPQELGQAQKEDVVFVLDDDSEPLVVVAVAIVTGRARQAPSTAQDLAVRVLPVILSAIVNAGDELTLADFDGFGIEELKEAASVSRGVQPELGEALLGSWLAHLESIGWWGDLTRSKAIMTAYAEKHDSAPEPTALQLPGGRRTNSEAAFISVSKCYDGPTALAMAHAYVRQTGLTDSDYSISALPSTGASGSRRRALTISVGVTEVLYVVLETTTGEITDWSLRVSADQSGHIRRWLDLRVESHHHGTFVSGADPRSFFRSLSDEDDQRVIRQGAQELVAAGKGHRRSDWHNSYLEDAILNPPVSPEN